MNNDGGPAFPFKCQGETTAPEIYYGMSLRDYFAAAALASMTVAPDYSKGPCDNAMATRAYTIADAMLAAREKGQG